MHVAAITSDRLIRHTGASEMEKTLMKSLFNGYNLKVRPALRAEERVVVRVGMVLSSFVGLVRKFHIPTIASVMGDPLVCTLNVEVRPAKFTHTSHWFHSDIVNGKGDRNKAAARRTHANSFH